MDSGVLNDAPGAAREGCALAAAPLAFLLTQTVFRFDHQPPQGTRTPELLIMLSALPRPRGSYQLSPGPNMWR